MLNVSCKRDICVFVYKYRADVETFVLLSGPARVEFAQRVSRSIQTLYNEIYDWRTRFSTNTRTQTLTEQTKKWTTLPSGCESNYHYHRGNNTEGEEKENGKE